MVASASWRTSVTPVPPPPELAPRTPFLAYAGTVTGAWAGVLSLLVYGIGRALGVSFEVQVAGRAGLSVVPWFLVLLLPLACGVVAGLLTALILGQRHARLLVLVVGSALTLLSLASPLMQPDAVGWSTRLWLVAMHLIGWAVIVPQLARIAADSEPAPPAP